MTNNLDVNSIVSIEQMPKIFYQLEIIGQEIDKNLKDLDKLVCTEENKQEVKKRKQEITALKNAMETKRKDIKKQILQDYELFNDKYENEVKDKLINAETILNLKITHIEQQQKIDKEMELREFAEEHFKDKGIQDLVTFENIGLNITLSASMKSLKEQVIAFCEKIADDLEVIMLEDMKDELYVEYKQCLNYSEAKKRVLERRMLLKEAEKITQKIEEIKEANEVIVENVETIEPIKVNVIEEYDVVENDTYEITFTVIGNKEQIIKLKEFLEKENIEWR